MSGHHEAGPENGHGHGGHEAAPTPFEVYQLTREPNIDQQKTSKARLELLRHMKEKKIAQSAERTSLQITERLLDDAGEDVQVAKHHFTNEKQHVDRAITDLNTKITEVNNKLQTLANAGSTATTRGEIFTQAAEYTQLLNEKDSYDKKLEHENERKAAIETHLTTLTELEREFANKGVILNETNVEQREAKVNELMGKYEEVARGIKTEPKKVEETKPGLFKKILARSLTPAWLAGGVLGGAVAWYLGIVWGEIVGGWKGGGGGKKPSGSGHH